MLGSASGVFFAALWNRTMLPGWTLEVTRLVISAADRSFQSRLSALGLLYKPCGARVSENGFFLSADFL